MSDQTPSANATADGRDPMVPVAFALGWQMADLYRKPEKKADPPQHDDGLPGVGRLGRALWTGMGIDQIEAGLHRLAPRLTAAGAMAPPLVDLRNAYATQETAGIKRQLYSFHVGLLTVLTAADFKLGKAYSLGRALSDTVNPQTYKDLDHDWDDHRLGAVVGWLADLESAFPANSARAVMLCLESWELWLAPRAEETFWGPPDSDEQGWTQDGDSVRRLLFGQGRSWRALLSREKTGKDMLAPEDYVDAADRALIHTRELAGRLLKRFWVLVVLLLALFVLGVVLALASTETAKILTGLGAVVSALGLSWKTLGTSFRTLGEHLKEPLWGAEIDEAIADAITQLPHISLPDLPTADRDELRRKYTPTGPVSATLEGESGRV